MSLSQRMLDAADVLEEVSALYGYPNPTKVPWTAADLVGEFRHVAESQESIEGVHDDGR